MENYNIKKIISNDKGITLVALIITVIVMLIIVGVSINVGTESLDSTRLQGFYTELEIIQKRMDDIATTNESYIDASGNTIYLRNQGTAYANLTTAQKNIITNEIQGLNLTASKFRYFTANQLEDILGLQKMQYNVFIDFDSRTVIAENGITINGETYYILKNNIYFPEYDTDKNQGVITSLEYNISNYGTGKYRILVTPSNTIGDLDGTGTIRYKKTTSKYWETSTNLEMIINGIGKYNVEYKDNNNNTVTEIIEVSLDGAGNPIWSKITT